MVWGTCAVVALTLAAAPAAAVETEVRDVALANGFVSVRLEIPRTPTGPKPAIIAPVGDREALLAAGAVLASYRVNWDQLAGLVPPRPQANFSPPQPMVGEWLLASPTARLIGQNYLQLVVADGTQYVPLVVDLLADLPEVDAGRIGISGASTAGLIALMTLAHDRRLAAAVIEVACGDFHRFLELSSLAMKGQPLDLDPSYDAWLREHEPIRHPERFVHAALLMLNGTEDPAFPAPCACGTAQVFRDAYMRAGRPERFRAVMFPDQAHNLGREAIAEAMAWWYRWLLRPGLPLPPG